MLPHARTVIGVKTDDTIVIVVAEDDYVRDIGSITAGEIQSLIQEKGKAFAKKYHHKNPSDITISELKYSLKEEFASKNETIGLT